MSNDLKILIAEDNDTNLMVITGLLQPFNADVHIAKDGQKAISKFEKVRPDLIFMDVSMPIMDGLDATKAIRTIEKRHGWAKCPIVAVTAHIAPADQHICISAGMNDYISKPISFKKIKPIFDIWLPAGSSSAA